MQKVNLPVKMPPFTTYHNLAGAGVAAEQNPTADIWYFNHTIQWTCGRRFLEGYTTPEVNICTGDVDSISFLDRDGISTQFVKDFSVPMIKEMLSAGYYVYFGGVDDFYVPGKTWYQERHFNHNGLISGFDDDEGTFTLVAYDHRWIYREFPTTQQGFEQGLKAECDAGEYGQIVAVRTKDEEQALSVQGIKERLSEYLNSSLQIYRPEVPEFAFGIVVLDYLGMYLDCLKKKTIPLERMDWRCFRLVWEHKRCMLRRIKAVEKATGLSSELSTRYQAVVDTANTVRFLYEKFILKHSDSLLDTMRSRLQVIKDSETEILTLLLERLENLNRL